MYVPSSFAVEDIAEIEAFVRTYPFATLVTAIDTEPFATHLPLVVERGYDESSGQARLLLKGHVARANPHWKSFGEGQSLAIFHGPHAYISPSWYVKQPAVPTWNYTAVHFYGMPRVIEAPEQVSRLLDEMLAIFEVAECEPLSAEQRQALEREIVAFEMVVERCQGKFKLNQNRSSTDRAAVVERLAGSSHAGDRDLGEFMRTRVV